MHSGFSRQWRFIGLASAGLFALLGTVMAPAQQLNTAAVIQQVDAAAKARVDTLAGYSVTEHYVVYRYHDEIHPAAEMTVRTTYKAESGKSYEILSQSGSLLVRKLVLGGILDNEKQLNRPGVREGAWITSANYEMRVKPGGTEQLNGRDCVVLALIPKRKASYLIEGTLWVDANDGSIVQVEGTTSANSSLLTGPTQVMRQYADIGGFPEAVHARAISDSSMFGQTVVTIDYRDYHIQLRPAR